MRCLGLIVVLCAVSACSSSGPRAHDVVFADVDRLVVVAVDNEITNIARRAGGTPRGYGASRYRASPSAQRDVKSLAKDYGLRTVEAWPIEVLGVHCALMRVDANRSVAATLLRLQADSRVVLAQPLQLFATRGSSYNDPYVDLQVGLDGMNVRSAHGLATGKGVRIAVIDTGVDVEHPDLAGRVLNKKDLVHTDFRGFTQDVHGTAVAGVIAATANNSVGIVGVAPEALLLVLKACWHDERSGATSSSPVRSEPSSIARCNSFTLARALAAAIAASAQVINMSLTGPSDPLLERLLAAAMKRGIHVVAAADEGDSFPASMRGIIGVRMAESAAPESSDDYLRAPGREILTLRPAAHYDFETGSSIAAANVTGVVALLLQHRSRLTSDEIRVLLATGASKIALHENAIDRSIDACAAVATLLDTGGCSQRLVRTARADDQKKPLSPTK